MLNLSMEKPCINFIDSVQGRYYSSCNLPLITKVLRCCNIFIRLEIAFDCKVSHLIPFSKIIDCMIGN